MLSETIDKLEVCENNKYCIKCENSYDSEEISSLMKKVICFENTFMEYDICNECRSNYENLKVCHTGTKKEVSAVIADTLKLVETANKNEALEKDKIPLMMKCFEYCMIFVDRFASNKEHADFKGTVLKKLNEALQSNKFSEMDIHKMQQYKIILTDENIGR
jgi:hypothetical protein